MLQTPTINSSLLFQRSNPCLAAELGSGCWHGKKKPVWRAKKMGWPGAPFHCEDLCISYTQLQLQTGAAASSACPWQHPSKPSGLTGLQHHLVDLLLLIQIHPREWVRKTLKTVFSRILFKSLRRYSSSGCKGRIFTAPEWGCVTYQSQALN